jgi:hypothetical protein
MPRAWHIEGNAIAANRDRLAEPGVEREPDRQVEDDPDDSGGDPGQRTGERLVVAQPFDERRAEADPQKARDKGGPGREQPAERARQHRRQRAGVAVGRHEADELHDHDQGARRRLRHTEPVEHLAGLEPAIGLDRLLRHIGEDGVGAAEGDDRHLGKEDADLAKGVPGAERRDDRNDRHQPQREPERRDPQGAPDRWPDVLGQVLAEQAVACGGRPGGPVAAPDDKSGGAGAGADIADDPGGQHDQRERHAAEEDRGKSKDGERDHRAAFERATADPVHRMQHDRQHRRLQPEEQGGDDRDLAERGVDPAQHHDRDDAGHDEQPAGGNCAGPAVHQPADIGRQLLGLGPGEQHAVAQRVQKPALADPFLLVDDDAVHDRDLPGRAAERHRRDAQPHAQRLAERDAVSREPPGAGRDGDFGHAAGSHQARSCGFQLWVWSWQLRHHA